MAHRHPGEPRPGARPGMGYRGPPRTHLAACCHQTMEKHVFVCYTSASMIGALWSGRKAIRYGPLPHHPGEPHPGARSSVGYSTPPRTWTRTAL